MPLGSGTEGVSLGAWFVALGDGAGGPECESLMEEVVGLGVRDGRFARERRVPVANSPVRLGSHLQGTFPIASCTKPPEGREQSFLPRSGWED